MCTFARYNNKNMAKQPNIITFFTSKGGVGKSALTNVIANELIYQAIKEGSPIPKVCVYDLDPQMTNKRKRDIEIAQLKLGIDSDEFKALTPELQDETRKFQKQYYLLTSQTSFMPYSIKTVDTRDASMVQLAIEDIEFGGYDYVFLDFPGTLEQDGLSDFAVLINYLFIPTNIDSSTKLGTDYFINTMGAIDLPSLKDWKLIFNNVQVQRETHIPKMKAALIEEHGEVPFLNTVCRRTVFMENSRTLIPISARINLNALEIYDNVSTTSIVDLTKEISNIIINK